MNWSSIIKEESEKDYFKNIITLLQKDAKIYTIYPKHKDVFNAFKFCPFDKVKCVLLAQDPYHNPGQAHGLSFSVPEGVDPPPSLKNIFKELRADVGISIPSHGCLTSWAKQGILLLNSFLTVRENQPASHRNIGWETFTDRIISVLNEKENPIAFILWGAFARNKKKLITNPNHLILESAHPSPLSAHNGFFGSKPFSQVNSWLINNGMEAINWEI